MADLGTADHDFEVRAQRAQNGHGFSGDREVPDVDAEEDDFRIEVEKLFGGGLRVAGVLEFDDLGAVVQVAQIRPQAAQGERCMGIAGVKR